jgi:hypothetical protein
MQKTKNCTTHIAHKTEAKVIGEESFLNYSLEASSIRATRLVLLLNHALLAAGNKFSFVSFPSFSYCLFFSFLFFFQNIPTRPVFRSYRPLDEELKKSSVPLAEPEEVDHIITKELDKAADPPVLEEIVRNRMGGIK